MSEKAIFVSIYCTIEKAIFLEQLTKISTLSPDLSSGPETTTNSIRYIYKLYFAIGKSSANMLENSHTLSCANFNYTNMSNKFFLPFH